MKNSILLLALIFSNIQLSFCFEKETDIIVDVKKQYQTIEGWGSSLCWWAAQVGNWEESKIDSIVKLFTSEDGANMNIFRYNIGGGDDPSHIDGHMVKGKGKRAEMEGFKESEKSDYNFNADKAQRKILIKIKQARPDAIFEAFSNTPPYWMTYSGCAAGNENPNKDNLKPEYYEMFCDYLVDVCQYYKDNYNIDFRTIEPFNESTSDYWNAFGSQEGCHFDAETQVKIINILYDKIKQSSLNSKIAVSDENSLGAFLKVMNHYSNSSDFSFEKVGQLNTHTYSGSNQEREEIYKFTKNIDIPFWQSETGPMGIKSGGLKNNLEFTRKLFDDMRLMKPIAWLDWQLIEERSDVWCLVQGDFKTHQFNVLKNYYVRMQISRFFKKGYTIVDTDNNQSLAAVSPDNKTLVISVLNSSDIDETLNIKFKGYKVIKLYRTSANEDCKEIPIKRAKNSINYDSPKESVATFICSKNQLYQNCKLN
ncbi:MAG: glycoside hydrolase [Bacteroidales bacterium]|nr:glycoside hydrolase [Bacteroidales bacterium]